MVTNAEKDAKFYVYFYGFPMPNWREHEKKQTGLKKFSRSCVLAMYSIFFAVALVCFAFCGIFFSKRLSDW